MLPRRRDAAFLIARSLTGGDSMLKYIAVRKNSNSIPTPISRTRQRRLVRESAAPLSIAKRGSYQQSIGMGGANGRRVLAAINRNLGGPHLQ